MQGHRNVKKHNGFANYDSLVFLDFDILVVNSDRPDWQDIHYEVSSRIAVFRKVFMLMACRKE